MYGRGGRRKLDPLVDKQMDKEVESIVISRLKLASNRNNADQSCLSGDASSIME